MSRISKKLYVGKIACIELITKDESTLVMEMRDECGGMISPLDIDRDDAIKLSQLFKDMAKEIRKEVDWR